MIDFEIDGEQHYNYQPTMDTDTRRTSYLEWDEKTIQNWIGNKEKYL